MIDLIGGGCQFCGYSKCIRNLSFHHLKDKELELSARMFARSWSNLKSELMKCVVCCHNCHGEIHDGLIAESIIIRANERFKMVIIEAGDNWSELAVVTQSG